MSDRRVVLSSAEYRVVTDRCSGYEAQYRTRWWPFWRTISSGNTSSTLDVAVRDPHRHARRAAYVVSVVGHVEIEL